MIRARDLGGSTGPRFGNPGPCHVFWFGGVCFTTAVWSDEPRSVEYVGTDEKAAVDVAERIKQECENRVEGVLKKILGRIGG